MKEKKFGDKPLSTCSSMALFNVEVAKMKIKIKIKKSLDEMSGVGAVAGYAGGFMPKEKEKLEEIGQSGVTFGAGRSINIKDPNDLHNVAPLDDEETFNGMVDRNEHNPHPNKAIDPQGKLLGEEEELEEGSMMGTVGTASEPDNGTYHEYGVGHDVGDWEYRDVMIARAKRKLNRAYAPFMTHNEMTAHINEGQDHIDPTQSDNNLQEMLKIRKKMLRYLQK